MQIQAADPSINRTARSPGGDNKQGAPGFARELDAGMQRAAKNRGAAGSHHVSLGTTSARQPTVSHLLAAHPDYGDECWDIIHSRDNQDKPFTRIPAGTEIYLDADTKEIQWQQGGGHPETAAANARASRTAQTSPASRESETAAIEAAISRAADTHGLPRELITSVIRAESGFETTAVSRAGAQGLMQLMPGTARELGVTNPFDIQENIDAGARYLKKMLRLFSGNLEKALAAYNAGPGTVNRFAGQVPYTETRDYVSRVLSFMEAPVRL